MPIRIAMPVAHRTGAVDYGDYYSGGNCNIRVVDYLNANGCQGIRLEREPGAPAVLPDSIWDLFAFTDGFLSFQDQSLVLRLPRELTAAAVQIYNSGRLFAAVRPQGSQLRHVVYRFSDAPGAAVQDKVRAILQDATHPGRHIVRTYPPGAVDSITLGNFIALDPANVDLLLIQFMAGTIELFVRAGDVIGNFREHSVELRWFDSCANPTTTPALPGGRPLSPAYFLYLIRHATNAAHVTMLTAVTPAAPNPPTTTHPLYYLLEPARVTAAGSAANLGVDLAAAFPPPPLHIRNNVENAAGVAIAGFGIPMLSLGEWHESRNAANPFNTQAPVRWRLYGNHAADVNAADFGRFITEAKAGQENRLPNGAAFDHQFAPGVLHTNRFLSYWNRYQNVFNRVAEAFQLPVELLIATACTETSSGFWYNATFANTHEMDIIRMEPLPRLPNVITPNAAQQVLLTNYMNLTGGVGGGGANQNLPVPWNGAGAVSGVNPLTWGDLRDLIQSFPNDVRVSPGIMQALVGTAQGDLAWGATIYGAGFVHALSITHNGVALVADNPPAARDAMFSDWFAVAVDAAGANTVAPGSVHGELTKMKRALHDIIAGAMHIKRRYNTIENNSNMVTDFDLPTSFSGFNDGAAAATPAAPADSVGLKWKKLFALIYYDENYPQNAPRFYNAAVNYFNTTPGLNPLPSVRLWRN